MPLTPRVHEVVVKRFNGIVYTRLWAPSPNWHVHREITVLEFIQDAVARGARLKELDDV